MALSQSGVYSVNATFYYLFVVADGYGKICVGFRTTHLYSKKDYYFLNGGDFVSSLCSCIYPLSISKNTGPLLHYLR